SPQALAAAFNIPRVVVANVMASRSMVAEAVYFASGQTGSLTKAGTVIVVAGGATYSPMPTDRLVVRLGGQVHEFQSIDAVGGNQSSTADGWLNAPHRLRYRHRVADQGEATIDEQFDGQSFTTHVTGWMAVN